jgi:hypothetical protein
MDSIPSSTKKKKNWVQWYILVVPASQETEAGRLQPDIVVRHHLKKKKLLDSPVLPASPVSLYI